MFMQGRGWERKVVWRGQTPLLKNLAEQPPVASRCKFPTLIFLNRVPYFYFAFSHAGSLLVTWSFTYGVSILEFNCSNTGSLAILRIFTYGLLTFNFDFQLWGPKPDNKSEFSLDVKALLLGRWEDGHMYLILTPYMRLYRIYPTGSFPGMVLTGICRVSLLLRL